MTRLRSGVWLAALLATACSEPATRTQWSVVIATDAPVPQLGDRLLVEVLDDAGALACSGCRRVFAAGDASSWPISFGVVPPAREGRVRVRARLHRADAVGFDGLPRGDAMLDGLATLPPTDQPLRVSMVLAMRCFGSVSDPALSTTCDGATGQAVSEPILSALDDDALLPAAGSWPPAQRVECAGDVPLAMACVPGGALLLGDPHAFPTIGDKAPLPERLVQLSPFALDVDEVSVGTVRQLVLDGAVAGAPVPRSLDPQLPEGACNYLDPSDASNDALPVNCVTRPYAQAVCEALGKRLPSEAEWEWAAGNLHEETAYPWGDDGDVCAHAVVGLGRFAEAYQPEPIGCRTAADGSFLPWGPAPGGHALDVTALGVHNLAGNVAEWVADRLASYTATCWSGGAPMLIDPVCDASGLAYGIRGSSWAGFALSARAAARDGNTGSSNAVGFRCAASM